MLKLEAGCAGVGLSGNQLHRAKGRFLTWVACSARGRMGKGREGKAVAMGAAFGGRLHVKVGYVNV